MLLQNISLLGLSMILKVCFLVLLILAPLKVDISRFETEVGWHNNIKWQAVKLDLILFRLSLFLNLVFKIPILSFCWAVLIALLINVCVKANLFDVINLINLEMHLMRRIVAVAYSLYSFWECLTDLLLAIRKRLWWLCLNLIPRLLTII